jgi:hypothetical protein
VDAASSSTRHYRDFSTGGIQTWYYSTTLIIIAVNPSSAGPDARRGGIPVPGILRIVGTITHAIVSTSHTSPGWHMNGYDCGAGQTHGPTVAWPADNTRNASPCTEQEVHTTTVQHGPEVVCTHLYWITGPRSLSTGAVRYFLAHARGGGVSQQGEGCELLR